jgi:hypothetical protein
MRHQIVRTKHRARIALVCAVTSALLPVAAARAQLCLVPSTATAPVVRLSGGLEWGGRGHAGGVLLARHTPRWFVAGEYADRGYALGRGRVSSAPSISFMERDHQVLGIRAGRVRPVGERGALCVSGGLAVGTGLRMPSSGDPLAGGSGFESHQRLRVDLEFVRAITIRGVQFEPSVAAGVVWVRETRIAGDIIDSRLFDGHLPFTLALGVPVGRQIMVRPRANFPPGTTRGPSFGADVSVSFGNLRR